MNFLGGMSNVAAAAAVPVPHGAHIRSRASSRDHVRKLVGSARHNLDNRAVDDDDGEGDYRVVGGREGPTAHCSLEWLEGMHGWSKRRPSLGGLGKEVEHDMRW